MSVVLSPLNVIKSSKNSTTKNVGGKSILNEEMNSEVTIIKVSNPSLYEMGSIIKIDDEYIRVKSIDDDDIVLCVRGLYDSSASSHAKGSIIYGAFLGESELNSQPDVMVSLKSDRNGREFFDFSNDNKNWDVYPVTGYEINENIHELHIALKGKRYFRIRYENWSNESTTDFRVNTYYGQFRQGILPLNQTISNDADSIVVRSVGTGANPNGKFANVPVSGVNDANSTTIPLKSTTITSHLYATTTTINVANSAGLSENGYIKINDEFVQIGTIDGNTLLDCKRGQLDTVSLFHFMNSSVKSAFVGNFADITLYHSITIMLDGTADSTAPGKLYIHFSNDGTTIHRNISINVAHITTASPRTFGVTNKYFRIVYENGNVSHNTTNIQTMFHTEQVSVVSRLNQILEGNEDVTNVRSIVAGRDPSGKYRNVPVDNQGLLQVNIQDPVSAFGDLRTIELTAQLHLTFPYNINTEIVKVYAINGAKMIQKNSMGLLQTSNNSKSWVHFQTKHVIKYHSGLGVLVRFTAVFSKGQAFSHQICGIGDEGDGLFFGFNGANFGIMRRRDKVDSWVGQYEWNLDTMNGNGPSTMVLNPTNINVYQISFQWLGAGLMEFSIEDDKTGHFTLVHKILYANKNKLPSIYNPSLPLYGCVKNMGNTIPLELGIPSMVGFVEGKLSKTAGLIYSFQSELDNKKQATFFTLRNKTTYVSKLNRIRCYLKQMSCNNDSIDVANFRIYLNATLSKDGKKKQYGGKSDSEDSGSDSDSDDDDDDDDWKDINGENSVMEVNEKLTYSSGGRVLFQCSVGNDNSANYDLDSLNLILIPGDTITLTGDAPHDSDMSMSIIWREDF